MSRKLTDEESGCLGLGAVLISMFAVMIGGWVTHVAVCIKTAQWLFLIAGAVLPPIGIIHGVGYWFGAW